LSNFSFSPFSIIFSIWWGTCVSIVVETSTTPGSATAAATRCSKATDLGTQ